MSIFKRLSSFFIRKLLIVFRGKISRSDSILWIKLQSQTRFCNFLIWIFIGLQAKRKKKKKQTQTDKKARVDKNQDRIPDEEIFNPEALKVAREDNPAHETEKNQGHYLYSIFIDLIMIIY